MFTLRRTKLFRWIAKFCCCRNIPDESSRRMMRGTRTFTTTSSTVTTSLTSSQNPTSSIHRNGNSRVVNFSHHTPIHFDKNNRWHDKETFLLYAWTLCVRSSVKKDQSCEVRMCKMSKDEVEMRLLYHLILLPRMWNMFKDENVIKYKIQVAVNVKWCNVIELMRWWDSWNLRKYICGIECKTTLKMRKFLI